MLARHILQLVRKYMNLNEHERLSNIALRQSLQQFNITVIAVGMNKQK